MEGVLAISVQLLFYRIVCEYVSADDNVTHVVQREGRRITLTCTLPTDDDWAECKFGPHDGSGGQCSVFKKDGGVLLDRLNWWLVMNTM